ncbi:MAG: GerMN domain-containing protein [Deltaproteobacteria bacterium]|nr:GerMN domain-containing protein [Deltaproteobacteria bacterium]MBW2675173.1 GerMN domain-containing protein [Deltaproteobacteria bacterium]
MGSKKKTKSRQIKAKQRKKNTRSLYLSLIILVGVGFLLFFFFSLFDYIYPPPGGTRGPVVTGEKQKVKLYFSDLNERFLIPEERYITKGKSPDNTVRALVEALIEGPHTDLVETFSRETVFRGVTVKNGIASIDFGRNLIDLHPGGSASEMMTIYSLTNTVIINVPSVTKVKILIDGNGVETIKGHIDTSRPFSVNREVIVENHS